MSWMFKETEHSQLYLKYRPKYPENVYKLIADKLKESYELLPETQRGQCSQVDGKWKLAIDVGCGPGTTTLPLTDYFHETFGIDSSKSQIYEAKMAYGNRDPSKVTFLWQDACNLSSLFEESSVDLITAGLSIHWLDRPKFYAECKKVLRPGGLLVAYGFGVNILEDKRDKNIFDEFYYGTVRACSEDGMADAEDCYARLFPELKDYFPSAERNDSLKLEDEISVEDYVGYLSTWSTYRKYKTLHPDKEDPVRIAQEKLKKIHLTSPIKRTEDIFILFGRNDFRIINS